MTETHEQRVERLARAICEGVTNTRWEDEDEYFRDGWRAEARAAIASDREAGLVTVPREPTEAMVDAALNLCWGLMDDPEDATPEKAWALMVAAHAQEERQDAP